jgi:hypothetical protein
MTFFTTVSAALPVLGSWLVRALLWTTWATLQGLSWLFWPVRLGVMGLLLFAALAGIPAQAGWFNWGPEPKIEAANQVLQRAAQIATEAARTQASQQEQLLAAVVALSNERTQLAGHLHTLGEIAARDSAWAAALHAAGPVLVAMAVLALGCLTIWMLTRAADRDGDLATVLVEEITGAGTGILLSHQHDYSEGLTAGFCDRNLIDIKPSHDHRPENPEPEELPF